MFIFQVLDRICWLIKDVFIKHSYNRARIQGFLEGVRFQKKIKKFGLHFLKPTDLFLFFPKTQNDSFFA